MLYWQVEPQSIEVLLLVPGPGQPGPCVSAVLCRLGHTPHVETPVLIDSDLGHVIRG